LDELYSAGAIVLFRHIRMTEAPPVNRTISLLTREVYSSGGRKVATRTAALYWDERSQAKGVLGNTLRNGWMENQLSWKRALLWKRYMNGPYKSLQVCAGFW